MKQVPCAACLLGAVGCSKVGVPVFSTFRLACERWADPDSGLSYQFGFAGTFDGEAREVRSPSPSTLTPKHQRLNAEPLV